jgi:hypothetical protein
MKHIEDELFRIEGRLADQPDPFEHAGLYAAQQALRWAAQPDAYASPYAVVTGSGEAPAGCSAGSRPGPLSGTTAC